MIVNRSLARSRAHSHDSLACGIYHGYTMYNTRCCCGYQQCVCVFISLSISHAFALFFACSPFFFFSSSSSLLFAFLSFYHSACVDSIYMMSFIQSLLLACARSASCVHLRTPHCLSKSVCCDAMRCDEIGVSVVYGLRTYVCTVFVVFVLLLLLLNGLKENMWNLMKVERFRVLVY